MSEIQAIQTPQNQSAALAGTESKARTELVCALDIWHTIAHWLNTGSRMSGDAHVRFCERLGVQLPWATHLLFICLAREEAMSVVKKICAFVQERLHLEIPDDKIAVVKLPNPIDILGVVTDGSRQWIRKATRARAERRLHRRMRSLHPQLLDSQCSYASIGVYDVSFS